MSEVRRILISDVCDLNSRSTTNLDAYGCIEYLETGSIVRNAISTTQTLYPKFDEIPSRAKRKVKHGSIIYSTVRPNQEHFGYLNHPSENLIVSTGFTTLDVKDSSVDSRFLFYLLTQKHITNYLHKIGENSVSSYPSINPTDIGNLTFRIPKNRSEQQQIAAVLSALDAKIDCNNRINVELEAMAKTLYDYWFVQFDFPDANGKPYKSSGGKMVYNPALKREIPEGWHDAVVADILDKTPSSTKILNKEILDTGVIPVIDQSQSYICGFTDEKSSLIVPKQPHVVFGDHTRVVKLVNFSYARGADGTQILVSKDMRMPGYLLHQVVSDIDLSSYGYARHYKFLKESKIILPNQTNAQKYQAVVTPWLEKTRESIFENLELARLRDWLLPLLMNGQVTVA